jgi:hypothetical protein
MQRKLPEDGGYVPGMLSIRSALRLRKPSFLDFGGVAGDVAAGDVGAGAVVDAGEFHGRTRCTSGISADRS